MVDFIGIIRIYALDGHVDIRLAGQQPYVANQHIVNGQFVNGQLERPARLHLWQVYAPSAIGVGGGFYLFLIEGDGNSLAGIGLSPNGDGLVTLHHHAVLEQLGQSDLGFQGDRAGQHRGPK